MDLTRRRQRRTRKLEFTREALGVHSRSLSLKGTSRIGREVENKGRLVRLECREERISRANTSWVLLGRV